MPHLRVAASEPAFRKLFAKVVEKFVFEDADSANLGPFTAGYDIKIHLNNGSVDLRSDGTVQVKELDIIWDRLNLSLGINIPEFCIPGFCLIPDIITAAAPSKSRRSASSALTRTSRSCCPSAAA